MRIIGTLTVKIKTEVCTNIKLLDHWEKQKKNKHDKH